MDCCNFIPTSCQTAGGCVVYDAEAYGAGFKAGFAAAGKAADNDVTSFLSPRIAKSAKDPAFDKTPKEQPSVVTTDGSHLDMESFCF